MQNSHPQLPPALVKSAESVRKALATIQTGLLPIAKSLERLQAALQPMQELQARVSEISRMFQQWGKKVAEEHLPESNRSRIFSLLVENGMDPALAENALISIGFAIMKPTIIKRSLRLLEKGKEVDRVLRAIDELAVWLHQQDLPEEREMEDRGLRPTELRKILLTWREAIVATYRPDDEEYKAFLLEEVRGKPKGVGNPGKAYVRNYIEALMRIWEEYTGQEPTATRVPDTTEFTSPFLDFAEAASVPVLGDAFTRRLAASVVWETKSKSRN